MVKISRTGWTLALVMAKGALALGALGCTTVEYADSVSQQNPLDAIENDLVGRINDLRSGAGAPLLAVCASLNRAASLHSDDMRDKGYIKDTAPDGSTPHMRACAAGYSPACDKKVGMAELLAKGYADAAQTLAQWDAEASTKGVLVNASFVVVGVGRSMGGESAIWTVDLAEAEDASCEM